MPDAAGLKGTADTLALAKEAGPDDLALVLLSGGGSANWIAPATGLGIDDKQQLTKALLASGAPISDINTVRKHLSRIKGGRLAALLYPARSLTLAISDVPGDDPSMIASGPTVPDPTTAADALRCACALADRDTGERARRARLAPTGETPKPGDRGLLHSANIGSSPGRRTRSRPPPRSDAHAGYEVAMLGDALEGEASEVGAAHGRMAVEALRSRPARDPSFRRGADRHRQRRRQGRTQPGICAGARAGRSTA